MADQALAGPLFQGTIDTNHHAETKLPAISGGVVSRWLVELESSSFSGSLTIKGRAAGRNGVWKAVPYTALHLNASAGTGGLVTTAITDTSLIVVDASGQEIDISCSSFSSGSMAVNAIPLAG